jgi:hypothetical protein
MGPRHRILTLLAMFTLVFALGLILILRRLLGIPAGSCSVYVADLYEFDISFTTPHTHRQ